MSGLLHESVTRLRLIGEHRAKALEKIGITELGQLIRYYPRRYLDRTRQLQIRDLVPTEYEVTVVGKVISSDVRRTRTGKTLLTAHVNDLSGTLKCIWFQGAQYWHKQLIPGELVAISGKLADSDTREFLHPAVDRLGEDGDESRMFSTGQIVALYPATMDLRKVGLESVNLRRALQEALALVQHELTEFLPDEDLRVADAFPLSESLYQVHFPESAESLSRAWRRIRFEEFFFHQLLFALRKHYNRVVPGVGAFDNIGPITRKVLDALPFSLTEGQKDVLKEVRADLSSPIPMQRLLHGEVGSGKTTVALLAAAMAADSGYQTAFMAPTEILALQHARTIAPPAQSAGLNVRILRGKQTFSQKREILSAVAAGVVDILVGTHALLNEKLTFPRLGLLVIDEQHRFGVEQRSQLAGKGKRPNLLVMTATPIPRTLRLSELGDLDVSALRELPAGPRKVTTAVRYAPDRERVYKFIIEQAQQNQRVFIICPLVEESDKIQAEAAVEYHKRVSNGVLRSVSVGLLHGRMDSDAKEEAVRAFREGVTSVLVATPVVEVGVDVPDASVMVVENPERLGLAALHQLRGRIGRKGQKALFILLPGPKLTEDAKNRLSAIQSTDDGFEIAELDFKLRGAGELFGTKQSGDSEYRHYIPERDEPLLRYAQERAFSMVGADPELSQYPALRERFRETHLPKLGLLAGG
ncbi:MAG: ATP-dependent DNA helicase RecG [Calditrichaeota bacterium]|nr:ATP-dependent DNA helicase RecG [Calditrichota bacterium]MCB9391617.1 ATP-dependent DNA helicase RecG [Calditrichota bacterium]